MSADQCWPWWPLLPLYPYGRRVTLLTELIPGEVWGLEQLQGIYYVAVPIRLTVVRISGGLMLVNPLPPTLELRHLLQLLIRRYGPVRTIVLPTASGLEHKLPLPALARAYPEADLWLCPGQWSFPLPLPSPWLGIPARRSRTLLEDGVPHADTCEWLSFGPLDLGIGRFQEISCLHRPSGSLLVTDALLGIGSEPPAIFNHDPTPLLFHARERGDEPLLDTPEARCRGWMRLVLFASYLRPESLEVPGWRQVLRYAFRPGLRTARAHFGIYPFSWRDGWESTANELIGANSPRLQVAPVVERLVLPRARYLLVDWLTQLKGLHSLRWLVPAHYAAPLAFTPEIICQLQAELTSRDWAISQGNWHFLGAIDRWLLDLDLIPERPGLNGAVRNH